jgi:hypothetical protein
VRFARLKPLHGFKRWKIKVRAGLVWLAAIGVAENEKWKTTNFAMFGGSKWKMTEFYCTGFWQNVNEN